MSSCKDKLMQVPVERYSGDIAVVSADDTITDAFEVRLGRILQMQRRLNAT